MDDLAERIEAAGVDEQRAMLEEAYLALFSKSAQWDGWLADSPERERGIRFRAMLYAEAYESAAMMLVPEGWHLQLSDWQHPKLRARGTWQAILTKDRDDLRAMFDARCDHAATPALALAAAAIRAGAK